MFDDVLLQKSLSIIETHLSFLTLSFTKLESQGISLFDVISEVNNVEEYVDIIPQPMGEIKQKCNSILNNNKEFAAIKNVNHRKQNILNVAQ